LNASNISNIQKELRPNKTVKGNSVFQNNKLTLLKSEVKMEGGLDSAKHGTITKLNAH
jgi:hypothetical protein